MIRNETFIDGVCIEADIIDLTTGTFAREEHGVIVATRALTLEERAAYGPQPLDFTGVAATLNVVLGLWPLEHAANAVGLTPDRLIYEAQAWAAAGELQ